jgi:hypothetical protein
MNTAPAKKSVARTQGANACSCDATNYGTFAGSMLGDDLTVAVGELVTSGAERDELGAGEPVTETLGGAPHETSVTASSRRSIGGR